MVVVVGEALLKGKDNSRSERGAKAAETRCSNSAMALRIFPERQGKQQASRRRRSRGLMGFWEADIFLKGMQTEKSITNINH